MPKQTKRHRKKDNRSPQIIILGGLALLVIAVLALKEKPQPNLASSSTGLLAEVQLAQALQANEPVLAFFHSTTCDLCIVMMDTVAQVYPQYQDSVTLVDVNVYDQQNEALLRQVRLQYIPTLIFYDRNGQADTIIGVMEASQLGDKLASLAEES